ncbi:MAG: after-VIT domain-containing protein [Synechococcales cyanobacterium CRU_2_2]|nr:after-VIT domain-containing protein [Synechococcales cyanobacterium CRU_2_2]
MKPLSLIPASLALGSILVAGLATASQTSIQRHSSGTNLAAIYTAMTTPAESVEQKPVSGLFVQDRGKQPDQGEKQAFPLKRTDVQADIQGNLSRVAVTQTFENPYDQPLEAVYVFPLPDEAAVDEMEIRIGDRIIKGDIKRREEAQKIYDQAVTEGRTAGLLEQERDNIFTQSLANIKPGETIEVTIRYTESLKFEGNRYEFVFPMVVGPRYIPAAQVPDADSIMPPVLRPGQRSGHDIGVTVNINAGVPLKSVESTSHKIKVSELSRESGRESGRKLGQIMQVQLTGGDTIPNKDLVLRYQVKGKETQATVLSQRDDRGGHFALYLVPAVDYRANEIVPKDVVFLMDTSGSQQGAPLAQSKTLMRRFINGLNPNDTFTIIDFANAATKLSEQPLANTVENRKRALQYVEALEANGGTELINGLNAVMDFPAAQSGRLRSVVLLTDGYVGNDEAAIAQVQKHLKPGNRLYSFGVGSSTNRFLLNRLAEVGRGTVQVVRQDEDPQPVVEKFLQQINRPVLTNIQVEWLGTGEKPMLYPPQAPDLFDQQPLVLLGRKADGQGGNVKVTGQLAGGRRYEQILDVGFGDRDLTTQKNPAIAQLWGRSRIKDLMNRMYGGETTAGIEAVTQTSLAYRLLSKYTAFVAVSEEVRVEPDGTRRTVQVPVELPEGVSYAGIFGDEATQNVGFGNLAASARLMAPAPAMMAMPSGASGGLRQSLKGPVVARPRVERDSAVKPEAAEATPQPTMPSGINPVTVVKAEGLDAAAIAQLEQHLATLNFSGFNLSGNTAAELVFELQVRRGQVRRVALDEAASAGADAALVAVLRDGLQRWQPAAAVVGKVRVVLRVQS